ncbi:MAG TPA: BON domain-containing protein [Pyrinomonadaceae bacterium]|nr:BON domain-containing protein [Pyrinomonadaceae bacterium]
MQARISRQFLTVAVSVCLAVLLGACKRGPDDATLTASVKSQLAAQSPALASMVNVETKDGMVTLNGTVDNDSAKSQAEQAAKGVADVKSVVNNLNVKPPIVVSEDPKIKSAVEANLVKYNVKGVTANVTDGEVTLTGEIPRAKLQDAMKAANEAEPKKVVNQLTIK